MDNTPNSQKSLNVIKSPTHLNVYIGFDTSNYGQTLAYEVCKRSILNTLNELSNI